MVQKYEIHPRYVLENEFCGNRRYYAHNGGRYDVHPVIKAFIECHDEYPTRIVNNGSTVYEAVFSVHGIDYCFRVSISQKFITIPCRIPITIVKCRWPHSQRHFS